jgi:hypothetical protein
VDHLDLEGGVVGGDLIEADLVAEIAGLNPHREHAGDQRQHPEGHQEVEAQGSEAPQPDG